jgi:hypothetical protein
MASKLLADFARFPLHFLFTFANVPIVRETTAWEAKLWVLSQTRQHGLGFGADMRIETRPTLSTRGTWWLASKSELVDIAKRSMPTGILFIFVCELFKFFSFPFRFILKLIEPTFPRLEEC